MGKGDKKTKRGKIIMGSYGVRRKVNKKSPNQVAAIAKPMAVTQPDAPEPEAPKAKPRARKAKPEVSEDKE